MLTVNSSYFTTSSLRFFPLNIVVLKSLPRRPPTPAGAGRDVRRRAAALRHRAAPPADCRGPGEEGAVPRAGGSGAPFPRARAGC